MTSVSETTGKANSILPGHRLVIVSALACLGGIPVGLVGGAFRWGLQHVWRLVTDIVSWAHGLGPLGVVVPILLVATFAAIASVVVNHVPLASGSGIQHVEAVQFGQADPPPLSVIPARFFGGLLAIGSGLVLGREGPTVHMGAAIGAAVGRSTRRRDAEVRTLQTSLAGAGLAVAFNAPIGGGLFVIEEVAKSVSLRIVVPTGLAVATAVSSSRLLLGDEPDFIVAAPLAPGFALLPVFIAFGVATGVLGLL